MVCKPCRELAALVEQKACCATCRCCCTACPHCSLAEQLIGCLQGFGQAGGRDQGEAEAGEEEGGAQEPRGLQSAAAGGHAGRLHQAQDALEGMKISIKPILSVL